MSDWLDKVTCINCGWQAESTTLDDDSHTAMQREGFKLNRNGFHVRHCRRCGFVWSCDIVTGAIFSAGLRMGKRDVAPEGLLFIANDEREECMKISVTCIFCETEHIIEVDEVGYKKWQDGACIQNVLPQLSDNDRELLINGTCGKCFAKIFGDEDE